MTLPRIRHKRPWDRENQDRKRRAKRLANRRPLIYFFRCSAFVKIGWTTDPTKRLSNMQLANPDKVAIAALMRGGGREEAVLHRAFAALHHRAEWFREEGALAELVGLIGELGAEASRYVAGDWFLKKFGKTDLLYEDQTAQKPDHGTAES